MKSADEITVFAFKLFASIGFAYSIARVALIVWPHGWHLSSAAVGGGMAVVAIVWGWIK